MSIAVMTEVWRRYEGPNLLLALALADCCADDGSSIVVSHRELCRKTRLSDRTVWRQINDLISAGWLQVAHERPGSVVEYRINPDWVTPCQNGIPPPAKMAPPPCQNGRGLIRIARARNY